MPAIWKFAVVMAGLMAAFGAIQESTAVVLPETQVAVAATCSVAASPLFATLEGIDGVNTWRTILTRSGYVPTSTRPVTILVPSDAAFATGDEQALTSLLGAADTKSLELVVRRTIIGQPLDPANFAGRKIIVMTLAGNAITLDATDQSLMVGDAEILAVKHASNGSVIFIVDHLPINGQSSDASDGWERKE